MECGDSVCPLPHRTLPALHLAHKTSKIIITMPASTQAPRLTLRFARLDRALRGDVLVVPIVIRQGKVVRPPTEGLPRELAEHAVSLAARHHGAKQPGSMDDVILPRKLPFARLAFVGLGEERPIKMTDVRTAAAAAAEWAARHRAAKIVLDSAVLEQLAGSDSVAAWVEGAVLSSFRFYEHRSQLQDDSRPPASTLVLAAPRGMTARTRRAAQESAVVAECVNLARALGHEPPNVINPVTMARRAQQLARRHKLRCRVLDERQLKARRMGAFLAVGGGSATPPRMIVLEHRPSRAKGRPIVLVGKAITHDTGGYSIKPTASMVEMKYDKCGGVAVLGAMVAAARLKLPRHVIGVIGAADNAISGEAYRPGDIVRSMSGKTIEVLDTDAEGRMVLADCLHYAEKTYSPAAMIDLATLTGSCTVALGDACAGLFSTKDALADALLKSGELTGDRLWRMPLWPVYREQIAGADADLKNVGGRLAGAITAAMFLKEFVSDQTPWAHLDIAGVASTTRQTPLCPAGATGFGVRLLVDYLRRSD